MQSLLAFGFIVLQAIYVAAAPSTSKYQEVSANAAFFLAGDSTTATQAVSGGGWGNGFLTTLARGSFGINYGHNGATTVSYRDGGDWAKVLASVSEAKGKYTTFVTIQVRLHVEISPTMFCFTILNTRLLYSCDFIFLGPG